MPDMTRRMKGVRKILDTCSAPVYLILVSLMSRWRLFPREPVPFSQLVGRTVPLIGKPCRDVLRLQEDSDTL